MLSNPPELAKKITTKLETIMDGTVFVKQSDNTFWIRKTNGEEIMFERAVLVGQCHTLS